MFTVLKLFGLALLKSHQITDEHSLRQFLRELILRLKSLAMETESQIDDAVMMPVEFVVHNELLFAYVYQLIFEQFQTPEILFESADEETITELLRSRGPEEAELPEAIDPVVIVSLVTQIISFINTIKNK